MSQIAPKRPKILEVGWEGSAKWNLMGRKGLGANEPDEISKPGLCWTLSRFRREFLQPGPLQGSTWAHAYVSSRVFKVKCLWKCSPEEVWIKACSFHVRLSSLVPCSTGCAHNRPHGLLFGSWTTNKFPKDFLPKLTVFLIGWPYGLFLSQHW